MLEALSISLASTASTVISVAIVAVIVLAVGFLIAWYFINDGFRETMDSFFRQVGDRLSVASENHKTARGERQQQRAVRDIIQRVDDNTFHSIMANVTAAMTQRGFLLQSQQPGLYTYARTERPSILLALILFLICFIPGIIYLVAGGGVSTATVQITQVPQGYRFTASGPAKSIARRMIGPYRVQPEALS